MTGRPSGRPLAYQRASERRSRRRAHRSPQPVGCAEMLTMSISCPQFPGADTDAAMVEAAKALTLQPAALAS